MQSVEGASHLYSSHIKDIGEFEFYFDGPTIRAFELLIQTLQESIPAMRAAGIE